MVMADDGLSFQEVVGGLGIDPVGQETKLPAATAEKLAPLSLLNMEKMSADVFFDTNIINRDDVYHELHRLQSLPVGNPMREKAMRILAALQDGEEKFRRENPGTDDVNFQG